MAKTLFAVLVAVVNGYGIELNDEKVAKDLRVLCGITNKKFFTENLEWFFELFYRYLNSLKKHGITVSDEWIIKGIVRAFRQNEAEHKFGGVSYLLRAYATEEIINYLHTGCKIDLEVSGRRTYEAVIRFVNELLASKKLVIGKVGLADRLSYLMDLHVSQFHIKADEYGFAVNVTLVLHQDPKVAEEQEPVSEEKSAEAFRHPLTGISQFIPLAKQCLNPMNGRIAQAVANLNITGSAVAHLSNEVKKEAGKDKTWFELSEKFPDGNISHIAIALAKTAELQERRHQAGTYKGINPLSDKEIEDKLWNPDAKYASLRNAALGKVIKENFVDKYEKVWFILHMTKDAEGHMHFKKVEEPTKGEGYYNLRLWINRKETFRPNGVIKVSDDAKIPFMTFEWGFRKDKISFAKPKLERRVPGENRFEVVSDEYSDIVDIIYKELVSRGLKPGDSSGKVAPGVNVSYIR